MERTGYQGLIPFVVCNDTGRRNVFTVAGENPGKLVACNLDQDRIMREFWRGGVVLAAYRLDYPHPFFEGVYTGLWGEVSCHSGRGKFFVEVTREAPYPRSHPRVDTQFFDSFAEAIGWFERTLLREKTYLEHCGFETELALTAGITTEE